MAALFGLIRRNYLASNPPVVAKNEQPLRFGILGAADIGPRGLILPAKSHPDVQVYAVAARNPDKAKEYANKHGIPCVKASYQEILDDVTIPCVYIPTPTALHYEWALRALQAGKHVLLEKPSTCNAAEAASLFRHSLLQQEPAPPVFMEAAHYPFHPAWTAFMSLVTPSEVESARATLWTPRWQFGDGDIRFRYELGGGALLDLGCYTASALWRIFGDLPEECEECVVEKGPGDGTCDRAYKTRFRFGEGRKGEMEGDLQTPLGRIWPNLEVVHRPVAVDDPEKHSVEKGQDLVRTRRIKMANYVQPAYFHSIEVQDLFEVREKGGGNVVKKWTEKRTVKAYTFEEAGLDGPGEAFWTTWRHQLEVFVDRVRGRDVCRWVGGEDSIKTMKMIDMAYGVSGLPARPTSQFKIQ